MRKAILPFLFGLALLAWIVAGSGAPADAVPQQPAAEKPAAGEPAESFEPSEKLPADSAISFPVDI